MTTAPAIRTLFASDIHRRSEEVIKVPSGKEPGIARIRDIAEAYLEMQARVDPDA